MSMPYAVQRYAATRPWAKRAGQLFSQSLKMEDASGELAEVVRRELDRAGQVFEVGEQTRRSEALLALAYGCFVREGRVIAHLAPDLAQVLGQTRLPSHLPDTLQLPAQACFLHVDALGGALLFHDKTDAALDLILVRSDLGEDSTAWLEEGEALCALRLQYPGELAPQLAAVDPQWTALLLAVVNGLALLTQPKAQLIREWEATAPAELVAQSQDAANAKNRQKARSTLLKQGYVEVSMCRYPELPPAAAIQTPGYWRRQAFGSDKLHSRLIWVPPR